MDKTKIRVYRVDFTYDENGNSYFDYILDKLGIPDDKQFEIESVILDISAFEAFDYAGYMITEGS